MNVKFSCSRQGRQKYKFCVTYNVALCKHFYDVSYHMKTPPLPPCNNQQKALVTRDSMSDVVLQSPAAARKGKIKVISPNRRVNIFVPPPAKNQ